MLIAIIADDLTGAADTGVQFVRAGYRTAVFFRATDVLADDLDAVSLDTDSRAMPAGFAAKRVLDAAHVASGARIVYKKLDSTLRGNVAAELVAALGGARRDRVVVAPAFPAAGRTTVGGIQRVHGVPVDETEIASASSPTLRETLIWRLLCGPCPIPREYSGLALRGSRSCWEASILGLAREMRACTEPRSALYSSLSVA